MIPISDAMPACCARLVRIAERDPRRAALLARRAHERNPEHEVRTLGWTTYALGWALLRWEHLEEARALLQQAEATFSAQGLMPPALDARLGILIAATLHGSEEDLYSEWERLAAAYEQQGLPLAAARARLYQAGLLNLRGQPRRALALTQTIYPLVATQSTLDEWGRLLLVIAFAQGECGELDQAEAALDQALAWFTQLGQPIDVARTLIERSWLMQRREHFPAALADLEQAQTVFAGFNMPLRLAFCDEHIGLLVSRLGRYDEALRATLRARAVFATSERRDIVANCDMHLGIVAFYCGLFDLAVAAYQRAQIAYKRLAIDNLSYVCQRNIALVRREQGQLEEALRLLQEISGPVEQMEDRLELAEITYAQAQILHDLDQGEAALNLFRRSQTVFSEHGIAAGVARSLLEQGWIYLNRGQIANASACFKAAAPALINRPGYHWRVDYGLGRCAHLKGQIEVALAHYRSASTTIAGLRRLLSEHASSAIFIQAHALFNDALDLAAHCNDPQAILEFAEQQRAIALQQQMLSSNALLREQLDAPQLPLSDAHVAASSDDDAPDRTLQDYVRTLLQHRYLVPLPNIPSVPPLDLEALRQGFDNAYPDGWNSLVFAPCGETLLIVTIDSQRLELSTTPLDHQLRHLLEQACLPRYRRYIYASSPDTSLAEPHSWNRLATLADRLLPTPIRERLHPEKRLLIVASGPLHALPWAALRLADAWLVERAVIQLLPSLDLWQILTTRSASGDAALLIGCSEFGERATPLHNTIPSLDLVQRHWQGSVTRLENGAASRQVLLNLAAQGALQRYRLIHLATHGQLIPTHGRQAHLKLVDHDLFYDEIAGLSIGGAVVVLAACDGAVSEVLPGEEILSLSRALLAAGARDVIASLWHIYDQTVLTLLSPLYQALTEGQDAAQALATAQRALIVEGRLRDKEQVLTFSPLIWANFCTIGAGTLPGSSVGGTIPTDVR